jgi:flagellar biosynthetic protein FliQ
MTDMLTGLYVRALETAAAIALPAIAAVTVVGVVVGIAQSLTGVNDQNVSFGPKLVVVWLLVALGAPTALALLVAFAASVLTALPQLVR